MFCHREYSGNHLIVDITHIRSDYDFTSISKLMAKTCTHFGFTVCSTIHKQFGENKRAFSILLLLSESHFSVHTYPESNTIAMDIYTCSPSHNRQILENIADLWREELNGGGSYQIIARKLR
jgi:S-adenosylmethionine/arginine decarboxylase-like enzyme